MAELCSGDGSVSVLVENLECLNDLLLAVSVLHLASHHGQELGKVNGAASISVYLVDHVHELCFRGVLAEGAHNGAKLLGGDGAIAVLVKQGECLLEFCDLLFGELVSHCARLCVRVGRSACLSVCFKS